MYKEIIMDEAKLPSQGTIFGQYMYQLLSGPTFMVTAVKLLSTKFIKWSEYFEFHLHDSSRISSHYKLGKRINLGHSIIQHR